MADKSENIFLEAEKLEKCGQNNDAFNKYSQYIKIILNIESETRQLTSDERKKLALAYNNRGFVRYLMVEFDEAIDDYSEGLKYDSKMHFSYYNRGLIHYRLGRYSEAVIDMEKCLTIKPQFLSAQQCLQQSTLDRDKKS